jgi:hypothetical protein
MIVSDRIAEKAGRLVDEHRVHIADSGRRAFVAGDTESYIVLCQEDRVYCPCPAWRPDRYCAHAVSVMLAWAESQAAA